MTSQHLDKLQRLAEKYGHGPSKALAAPLPGIPTREPLRLGGAVIPFELENRHILAVGTTGSGKTQAMRALHKAVKKNCNPAIIVDHGGEALARLYDPENTIVLNPFDERSVGWNIFNELVFFYDSYGIAEALIPEKSGGSNQDWQTSAQALFADILDALDALDEQAVDIPSNDTVRRICVNYRTNEALLTYIYKAQVYITKDMNQEQAARTLQHLLRDTGSANLFTSGNEKSLAIIRGIVGKHCRPLTFFKTDGDFSITEFVLSFENRDQHRWLHLSYSDRSFQAVKPLLGLWVSLAIQAAMMLSEDGQRRFFFFLDELASLGMLPGLQAALEKVRKVGGVVIAGIQTTAQLYDIYGEHAAQNILANFNHLLTLKVSDDQTAEKLSKMYGQVEFWDESYNASTSFSSSDSQSGNGQGQTSESFSDSSGVSYQRKREDLIMPSEFINLPDLSGWARIARQRGQTDYQTAIKVEIPYIEMPVIAAKEKTRKDALRKGRTMPVTMMDPEEKAVPVGL